MGTVFLKLYFLKNPFIKHLEVPGIAAGNFHIFYSKQKSHIRGNVVSQSRR